MCGIAGFSGEDEGKISRMTAALVHRGPDGNAVCVSHGASFGHARLAILDPSAAGNQPMWNEDRTVVMVFNGEIYNYRELREKEQFTCRTGTDTEVLLKLYDRYRSDFIGRLQGMFAFAIYDTRTSTFLLARDFSGIKPLYVAYPNGQLHFASEMRSLMQAFSAKPALNRDSLTHYLRLQYVPGPETMCEGIESLPAGTALRWCNGQETRWGIFADVKPQTFSSARAFRSEFPALMDKAVQSHCISDRPVGVFLSGGMDSSIVLHHMVQHSTQPVRTFTVRFEATEEEGAARFNQDADLAKLTAVHYGTQHTELVLTADMYAKAYSDTARGLDQPNSDHVSVAQYLLAKLAKQHVDVVLTGNGGDELFGGYPRYRIARNLAPFTALPGWLRKRAGDLLGLPGDVLALNPGWQLAERLLSRPGKEWETLVRGSWFAPEKTSALLREKYLEQFIWDPVREMMEFDRRTWLIDESLRLSDGVTMGSGLEARVPFLDVRVIAAALQTPSRWHVTPFQTKALLKRTYRNILPAHLFTLGKASFYPPLAKWLRRESGVIVERALQNRFIQEHFDVVALENLYQAHRCKETYALHALSAVAQLGAWAEEVYGE